MGPFQENISLASLTNYRIGGPASFFFEARNPAEVLWAVQIAKERSLEVFILGAGTNVLVPDEGFKGLVLRPHIDFIEVEGNFLRAGAGALMRDVLSAAAEAGLSGLEWAGGLPGTIGGAVRGNAGAFRGEIKDTLYRVESLDTENLLFLSRTNSESQFSYRASIFKERGGKEIILSAVFSLTPGDPQMIRQVIQEKVAYRLARHPMEYPNVGSMFKNIPMKLIHPADTAVYMAAVRNSELALRGVKVPVKIDPFPVIPTAFLISQVGLKGESVGGAMVSPKHPNFIVNALNARASDVRTLISLVKERVTNQFAVNLEEEVHLL